MVNKVSKISEGIYQVNDSITPVDEETLNNLIKDSAQLSIKEADTWYKELGAKGENSFEDHYANKGTVVNIYEVDYPQPKDPNKESQEMAKYLDEYEDAISQNLFPGIKPEDVIITQREEQKATEGRFFNKEELREKAGNVKRGWKEDPIVVNIIETLKAKGQENAPESVIKKLIWIYLNYNSDRVSEIYQIWKDYLKSINKESSKSSWRQVLGETETAPSPVKTPRPKEPGEVPIKEPSRVNPFKKPEHIRPSKEPQPKALPITYPQGAKLKIHPELEKQINSKNTPYHTLPQLPGGDFIENIASDRFKLILRNLERYSGKPVRSLRDIAIDLMDVIKKIDQIERQHISELENLAVSLVEQHFGIDPREVGFDAKLVRNVTIEDIKNISPEEEKSIEKELPTIDVDLEVSKRTFINGLIQGAGINSLNMFHLVSDELNTLDPNLINMYGLLTAFAELGYWVTPSLVGLALSGGPVGGKVKLDFSQEEPKVVAVAINFPILVQELVKGVMELMSSHGLPEDESVRDEVLHKADTLEDESWDIRFGPEIWKKLLFHINTTELDGRSLSVLYYNLVQLDAATFSDFVYKILSNNPESISKWNEMYQEALNQSSGKTSSLNVYTNQDEELVNLYNQYRKEALSEGKTPELYFNWIKDI